MNRKSYLKGFGLGVLIASLILMIAFKLNTNISDDDVIKRAKELGYVDGKTLISDVSNNNELNGESEKKEEVIDDDTNTEESKKDSENKSEENETEKEELKEEVKNEDEKSSSNENVQEITEKDQSEDKENNEEISQFVIVEIRSGESSETVSSKVKEAGLVENASDFNKYLCQNGYDKIMRVGKYEIPIDANDEEIAKILSGKK